MKSGALLGAVILLSSLGCLIWPFPTGELLSGRGRIRSEDVQPLAVGQASRAEVLLRLGEPDEVLEDGSVFVYRWTEVRGLIVFASYGGGGAIPFPGHRDLRLAFDGQGRLVQVSFGKGRGRAAVP